MHPNRNTPRVAEAGPADTRSIRIRYAAMGVFMALTWIGESSEPAWAQALRTVVILLIVPPLLLLSSRRLTQAVYESANHRWALVRLIAARTLILWGAFGIAYELGHLVDPHAANGLVMLGVRLLLVLLTIPFQIRAAHRTRRSEVHPSSAPVVSIPRLIGAKLTLVVVALAVQLLLDRFTQNAGVAVALAIAVTVARLGPRVHTWLMIAPESKRPVPSKVTV
jgi:hypothetical protein